MTVTEHAITLHVVRVENADKEGLCDLLKKAAEHIEGRTHDEITDVTVHYNAAGEPRVHIYEWLEIDRDEG